LTLYDERKYGATLLLFFEYVTPEDREADIASDATSPAH
jgi:hypothetical protein